MVKTVVMEAGNKNVKRSRAWSRRLHKAGLVLLVIEALYLAALTSLSLIYIIGSSREGWYDSVPWWVRQAIQSGVGWLLVFTLLASIAIAWFARYPDSIRFGLVIGGLSTLAYYLNEIVNNGDLSDPFTFGASVIAACIAVVAFAGIPFRHYFGTVRNKLQLIPVVALLLLMAFKAVEVCGLGYDFWGYYFPDTETYWWMAIIIIAAWLALSRTKTGWVLALILSLVEVYITSTAYEIVNYTTREPFIPLIIACLLCSPTVFRWYFPRREEEKPICSG
jgi:hypothetical protein